MKNIIRTITAFLAGATLVASCQENVAEPLSNKLALDKAAVSVAGVSGTATVNVTADGDWLVVNNNEWFTVSPQTGTGNGVLTITAEDNTDSYGELKGPRTGEFSLVGGAEIASVKVSQNGEKGLDASHTYTKITSADKVESGKGYLIVANDGKALQAAKAFAASSDTYYSYLYPEVMKEEKEGVIVRSNASYGFVLTSAGEGLYTICMPNGRYLFQSGSYNNFYSTEDVTKANKWKLEFQSNGTVKIINTDSDNKFMQYSITYSSYGSYAAAQDNAALPCLYLDSAAPSDEKLSAENVTVSASATSATIKVSSNKTWSVRNHDSWIKSFSHSNGEKVEGDGTIEVTFDKNESETEARTATFLLVGQDGTVEVTLKQNNVVIVKLPFSEKFDKNMGGFEIENTLPEGLSYVWSYNSSKYMKASAYAGGKRYVTDSYLVSPIIDLTSETAAYASFDHCHRYCAAPATYLLAAVREAGSSEWKPVTIPAYGTGSDWNFVNTGDIDLSAYAGKKIQFAFRYTSDGTGDNTSTWEVKNFAISKTATPQFGVSTTSLTAESTATTASFDITGNVAWTVTCPAGVTADKTSGTGAATIALTFAANTASEAKTYAITVATTAEVATKSYTVTLNQAGVALPATIAEVAELITATSSATANEIIANLSGAIVTFAAGNNFFIEDATAGMQGYISGHSFTAGTKISGKVTIKGYIYNGNKQFSAMTLDSSATTETATIPCTTITVAQLNANVAKYYGMRVKVEGVTVTKTSNSANRSGEITQGTDKVILYAQKGGAAYPEILVGSEGDAVGYPTTYNGTPELGIWLDSDFTYTKKGSTLKFAESSLTLSVGDPAKANPATSNGSTATVTYESSNTAVATVDASGNVTAVSVGTATITASIAAAGIYTAATATCAVTVTGSGSPSTTDLSFDFTAATPCTGFPSASGTKTGTHTINGQVFTFNCSTAYYWTSSLKAILFGKTNSYIELPSVAGKKLTKVKITTSSGGSTSVMVGIYDSSDSAVAGGADIKWSATSSDFTYNLSGTANDAKYRLKITSNHNAQLSKLVLSYE